MKDVSQSVSLKEEVVSLYRDKTTWKEGEHLEFKRAAEKLPEDMWETYSAFANTHGGIIVLGVEDNGKVSGVQNPHMLQKRLTDLLNNDEKISVNLCWKSGSYCTMELDGKKIIAIRVPEAEVKHKPVYCSANMAKSFFRSHESDVRCKEEMIQQMLRDKMSDCASSRLIPHTTWDCIDPETWRRYRTRIKYSPHEHPWADLNDMALLEKLGGYVRSEDGSEEGLTLAGLLMFGTDDAIRKFFPRYHVDFREYDGREREDIGKRWIDRILNDGSWNANLFQFFFRILPRLTETLKRPFRLEPDLTAQGETSAHKAIREVLANAIIHADYDGVGGVVICKYPDRVVFANPGTLLVSRDVMFRGGTSECRNKGLQAMFYFMGVIEKAGSGVDIILKGWMEHSFRPPQVEETYAPERVIWTLPFVSIIPKEDEEKLKEHIGIKLFDSLSSEQRMLLLIVRYKKEAGSKEIREFYPSIHPSDLSKRLAELERLGCLESEGRTTAKVYRLAAKVSQEISTLSEQGYPVSVLAVRKKGRVPRDEMQRAILDLCAGRWITIGELCEALKRTAQALHIALIFLEAKGKLELRYPEKPNHPQQAYHTK